MAFRATKYFVLIVALVIGGTRYMNSNMKRVNLNGSVGVWDTKAKDGLRYTVVTRSNETGREYFLLHVYCTTKGLGFYPNKPCSPPMHFHDIQAEDLEVTSGVMVLSLNGTEVQLAVGEKYKVPAGMPHTFWNGGSAPMEVLVRLTPGIPDEGFFETLNGLALEHEGLNQVNPIQLLLLLIEGRYTLMDVPPPVWAAAKFVLVPLAKAMGFRDRYPEYVTQSGQPLPVGEPAVVVAAATATATE